MKSSSNPGMGSSQPGDPASARDVKAWMPSDFAAPQQPRLDLAGSPASLAQELLAILGPRANQAQTDPDDDPRLIRAADASRGRLRGWDLAEFTPAGQSGTKLTSEQRASGSLHPSTAAQPLPEGLFPEFPRKPVERRPERKVEAVVERVTEVRTQIEYVVDLTKQAQIMAEAREQADQLISQARENADRLVEQAKELGRRAVEEGLRHGLEQGLAEAASSIRAAQAIVHETAAWREQVVAQSEEAVIEMIRRIARLMFGEGLQLDKSALQIYLNEVMESTRSLGELNIFLSPADYHQLDSAWAEYYTQIRGIRVTVIGSNNILPGGCYVQGQLGTVDARVETKLSAVIQTLQRETENEVSE